MAVDNNTSKGTRAVSDFERYRVRNMRNVALENLYKVTKRVLNISPTIVQSERIQMLADLQKAIEDVEKHPVPRVSED